MAKLTLEQAKRNIEREKKKQEQLKKKMEVQKKIELYGENWKEVEHQKIEKEIEVEIGGTDTPKIYDSVDLYDFFDPIIFYKNPENEHLNMDFKKFTESSKQYEFALAKINRELLADGGGSRKLLTNSSPKGNVDIDVAAAIGLPKENQNIKASGEKAELKSSWAEDGVLEEDDSLPIEEADLDKNGQVIASTLKKDTPIGRAKGRLNQIAATYLNRFVPVYNKYVCTCCGIPKQLSEYYIVFNTTCSGRVDEKGSYHMWICKSCVQKLFAYYYSVLADKNLELAMQYLCANLNLYWDPDLLQQAKESFEEKDRKGSLVGSYIQVINRTSAGMSFIDSPFLNEEKHDGEYKVIQVGVDEAPYDWSVEDAKNKKTVFKMVGYDPFEYEPEEDKKILYRDFLNILDEGMENDFVKFQAGIQIVQSFYKIRKMNERLSRMVNEDAPLKDQKDMADLKAKELKSITDFSRDNGFSERYATAKARGENTLTGIMNKMNEQKYEKAILNRYNIETSETIQQAADASFKAIFSQLGLGESEVWKITQEQFEELTKLRKENSKLQEELRLAKYRVAEVNLQEKARAKEQTLED